MGAGHGHHHHHHGLPPRADTADSRYRELRWVTLVGSVIDFALGVVKIIVGVIANSQALIADGIHSFSDLVTDGMVIFAAKHGAKEADQDHPYGHRRFETIATVALGGALVAVAIGIAWDAIDRLFNPQELLDPGVTALAVALASVALKEWIYHYTMAVARRQRSKMLEANAWHSRSDAISSVVVFIGVGGTMLGLTYLDAIAAVIVALMIAKIGFDLAWHSIQELADAALEAERVQAISDAIVDIDGVRELHMLRSRRMGQEALVDVHVIVHPWLSVSEGHMIALAVEQRLKERFDEITDVTVHVDPEDDEAAPPCDGLPLREEAIAQLRGAWSDFDCIDRAHRILLHYLAGSIKVDLLLPLDCFPGEDEVEPLRQRLQQLLADLPAFGLVKVYFG